MFDLFRGKDKAARYLLGGLLTIVALSMVTYLIPGAGSSTTGASPDVVAQIGSEKLTTQEVQNQVQSLLKNKQFPAEMLAIYIPQLIDQMVTERALAYQAKRMGFEVPDADLAQTIRSLPGFAAMPPGDYQRFIEQQNLTVPQFEENIRKNSLLLRLKNIAMEGVVVTPAEAQQEYVRRNEKIKLQYIGFDASKLRSGITVTPADIQDYYNRNRGFYTTPEARNVAVVVLDQNKVAQEYQVTDPQLQQMYNANRERYAVPERVHIRHILVMTQGKSKEESDKLKAKADDLLKQVKAGGDFAELAKKNSDDPGSKDKGGDLSWVTRGQTVKEFEQSAFSLKPKEFSNVITTQYGYHILQALEKEEAHQRTFAEVKPELEAEAKRQGVVDKYQQMGDQMRADLVKAPGNAEQIAQKYGAAFAKADNIKPADALPLIGADKALSDAVSGLAKNQVSPVTPVQANTKLAVVVVTGTIAAHPSPLAEVESTVRDRIFEERAGALAQSKAKEASDKLRAGEDMATVAKSLGGEVKTTDFFNRQGAAEGLGAATYFADAFTKPVGSIIGPVNVMTQQVAAKVIDKQPADLKLFQAQREDMVQQLKTKKAGERELLFQDSVVSKLIQEGKVKINKDVVNRLVRAYQS